MKYFENKGSFQEKCEWSMFWNIDVNMDHSILFSNKPEWLKAFENVFARSQQNEGDSFGEPSFKRNNFGKTF